MTGRVILLDLNFTLVANSPQKRGGPPRPYAQKIDEETYRQWLVELCRGHVTHLVTVRPVAHERQTMEHIEQLTGWLPDAWHFNPDRLKAPLHKRRVLHDAIMPLVGADASFLAIESNPFTTQMYRGEGVQTVKCYPADDLQPWASLPLPIPTVEEP